MSYTLNGAEADIDEEPEDRDGIVYVPFAKVTRALGGTVAWDNDTKTAHGTIGQWTAMFTEASDAADVTGGDTNANPTHVTFSAPTFVDGDELYVPADFFQAAYGYKVTANGTDVVIAV